MPWHTRILFGLGALVLGCLASIAAVFIGILFPVIILIAGVFCAFYIPIFGELPKSTPPDNKEYTQ